MLAMLLVAPSEIQSKNILICQGASLTGQAGKQGSRDLIAVWQARRCAVVGGGGIGYG